jgi:hypothetical protein
VCAYLLAQAATTLLAARLMPDEPAHSMPRLESARPRPKILVARLFGAPAHGDGVGKHISPEKDTQCPSDLRLVGVLSAKSGSLALVWNGTRTDLIANGDETSYGTAHIEAHRVRFERADHEPCATGFVWATNI